MEALQGVELTCTNGRGLSSWWGEMGTFREEDCVERERERREAMISVVRWAACRKATASRPGGWKAALQSETESLGGWSGSGTPGNIPNPVVKPASADGTRRATSRESRSSPKDFFFLSNKSAGSFIPAGLCF